MGLHMYLTGRNYHFKDWENPDNNPYEDGYRLQSRIFDLGYWRKHPDLHGFIARNFADGIDDCRPVYWAGESIDQIIAAIKEDRLPPATGFFFSQSTNDDDEKAEAIDIFLKALQWLRAMKGTGRSPTRLPGNPFQGSGDKPLPNPISEPNHQPDIMDVEIAKPV